MKLSSTANSIDKIANVGSTENVSRKIILYQKCNCKIIGIEKATSGNKGKVVLLGNADSTNDGMLANGDVIILTTRSFDANNEVTLGSQPSYSSTNKVTTVTIPTSSNFSIDELDVGGFVCKKIDITDYIVEGTSGEVRGFVEDGFSNVGASDFSFSVDNSGGYFFDRKNKSGIFYSDSKLTNVADFNYESEYASKHEVYTTKIKVDDISSNLDKEDYVGHHVLFNTGNAMGYIGLIIDSFEDNYFEVIGYLSDNYFDPVEYGTKINKEDSVYLNVTSEFYFRVEFGILSEPTERKNILSGKLDLSTVSFDNFDTILNVTGYSFEKELDDKTVGDVPFDSYGVKGTALTELNNVYYDSSGRNIINNSVKEIVRTLKEDEASFLHVDFAAYDLVPGWHIVDVIPNLNLFRFNMGRWTRIRDFGDLEYATNSMFLQSCQGEIPDHSGKDGSDETKAHYGWVQLSFQSNNDTSKGVSSENYDGMTNDFTTNFEKVTGLPTEPKRFFLKLSEGCGINKRQEFLGQIGYQFNGGETVYPEIYPSMLFEGDALNSLTEKNYDVLVGDGLAWYIYNYCLVGANNKFNGVNLVFIPKIGGGSATDILYHLGILYSTGGNIEDSTSWTTNVSPKYCGAKVQTVTSQTQLKCFVYYWDASGTGKAGNMSADELNGMYLRSVNGDNFGQYRKITDFSIDGSDYGDIVLEDSFANNVSVNDQFEVVNKKFELKIKDFGNMFNGGPYWDCAFAYGIGDGSSSGLWHDHREDFENYFDDEERSERMSLMSELYLGKDRKYKNIVMSFWVDGAEKSSGRNDLINLELEYWNGNEWTPVEKLSMFDVDCSPAIWSVDDDQINYVISFDCPAWTKRDASGIYASAVNNDRDLYYIRVKAKMPYYKTLIRANIYEPKNLFASVVWEDLKNWNKNTYTDDNCLDYGTLNTIQVDIQHYYVALCINDKNDSFERGIIKCSLINKLVGHDSDSLYAYFDMKNIENEEGKDYIAIGKNEDNNLNVVPRISTDHYLMKNVGKAIGLSERKISVENYLKDKVDADNKFLNIIGVMPGVVKVIPAKLNWDSAKHFYTEAITPLDLSAAGCDSLCVIKDSSNGQYPYEMFTLEMAGGDAIKYRQSEDGLTWGSAHGTSFSPAGNYPQGIKYMSVLKDNTNGTYHMWFVGEKTATANRVFYATWTAWGTFTIENSGNAVITEGAGGTDDENGIEDICVTGMIGGRYQAYYTGKDASNEKRILLAYSSDGTSWTKVSTPIIEKGSGGEFDDTEVDQPCVVRPEIDSGGFDTSNNLVYIYYRGYDGTDWRYGLAVQGRGANSTTPSVTKYSGNPLSNITHGSGAKLKSLSYVYQVSTKYQIPYSYDRMMFYYVETNSSFTSYWMNPIFTTDGINFSDSTGHSTQNLSDEMKDEFAEYDKFISDQVSISLSSSTNDSLLLGFRDKFNYVDLIPSTETNAKLKVEYWNGVDWDDLSVFQLGSKSNLIENKTGFYFDHPKDWASVDVNYLVENNKAYTASKSGVVYHKTPSLFWIRLSGNESDPVGIKSAKLLKNIYVIADKNDIWILKDDGFLEHKFCATRAWSDGTYRYEIIDVSYNSMDGSLIVMTGLPKYSGYCMEKGDNDFTRVRVYKLNIFDKVNAVHEVNYEHIGKDNKYIYRRGAEFTSTASKKIRLIGYTSDAYKNSLGG